MASSSGANECATEGADKRCSMPAVRFQPCAQIAPVASSGTDGTPSAVQGAQHTAQRPRRHASISGRGSSSRSDLQEDLARDLNPVCRTRGRAPQRSHSRRRSASCAAVHGSRRRVCRQSITTSATGWQSDSKRDQASASRTRVRWRSATRTASSAQHGRSASPSKGAQATRSRTCSLSTRRARSAFSLQRRLRPPPLHLRQTAASAAKRRSRRVLRCDWGLHLPSGHSDVGRDSASCGSLGKRKRSSSEADQGDGDYDGAAGMDDDSCSAQGAGGCGLRLRQMQLQEQLRRLQAQQEVRITRLKHRPPYSCSVPVAWCNQMLWERT